MATPTLLLLISLVFFFSLSIAVAAERCHPNDKKALLQIKKDLNNPLALTSWNPKTDCCEGWSSVFCSGINSNRTTSFDLIDVNLNRLPIPSAVGDLPFLQSLSFQNCNLIGPIPQAISKLSDLEFLDLRHNHLTGPIPAFLGRLTKLRNVLLFMNRLTGPIPASLSQLPQLSGLVLNQNDLTGSIPETFADFKHPEISISITHNQLSGTIPRRLGNANFSSFSVSNNKLEGDISFMFGKKKNMEFGDFSRNRFEFDLSKVEFPEALLSLDLSNNKIYGSLPKDLSSTRINAFNVSYNRLCGPIPDDPRFQTFDVSSFLHNKCLCGKPLPPCK